MSTIADALAEIALFETYGNQAVAWQVDRGQVLTRLRALVQDPDLVDQRGLNVCGPAVFFRVWLSRDPKAAAQFGCSLLSLGFAPLGNLMVQAGASLLGQDYAQLRTRTDAAHPNSTPEVTDWMLLSALRDSENIIIDYLGEPYTVQDQLAGITLPGTLASWFTATGLYTGISEETNLIATADRQRLLDITPDPYRDIVLFIKADAIFGLLPGPPNGQPPDPGAMAWVALPNHYVLLRNSAVLGGDPGWLWVDCWTWGKPHVGWQGTELFFANYFGVIVYAT